MDRSTSTRPIAFDLLVLAGGLFTTLLTLIAVYWLSATDSDLEIMGWYALFVIPAGAIIVGLGSGSGYGLLSWLTGRKVGGGLLLTIAVFLVLGYAMAQWLEFLSLGLVYDTGEPVGFFEYYDLVTRSIELSFSRSKSSTGELGLFGYVFRLLELVGFVAGGLMIPFALRLKPYCESCNTYMRSRSLGLIPAGVPHRKVKKRDQAAMEAYQQEMEAAFQAGADQASEAVQAAEEGDPTRVKSILEKHAEQQKAVAKLLQRFELTLSRCPRCDDGVFFCKLHSGQGQETQTQEIAAQAVPAAFSRQLR